MHTNRVVFAGDYHSDTTHARWVFEWALEQGADLIIQCGDHGYWPHTSWGPGYVDAVADLVTTTGIPLWWVDGNHDNHDLLAELPRDPDGLVTLRPGYRYIPRNTRFEIGGVRFLGHGGAWSVDEERRTEGESWWAGELITPEQVTAVGSEPVDVLVTHEAPYGRYVSYKDALAPSIAQRHLVAEIAERVQPQLIVHGHHHTPYRATYPQGWDVIGLGRDGMRDDSVALVDLDELRDSDQAAA